MKWNPLCLLISLWFSACSVQTPPAPPLPVPHQIVAGVIDVMEIRGIVMTQDHWSVPHLKCLLVVDEVPDAFRCGYNGTEISFYVPGSYEGIRGAYLLLSAENYQSVNLRIANLHDQLPRQLLVPVASAND